MDLLAQLNWLDSALLSRVTTAFPDPFNPEEKAALAAYLVLTHACIEEALEDAFEAHANALVAMVHAQNNVPLAVVRFSLHAGLNQPSNMRTSFRTRRLRGTLIAAVTNYKKSVIEQNHGIKQENMLSLAEGVGLEWEDFELALNNAISDLSTLGAKRGSVGHLSPFTTKSALLTARVDVADVRSWVKNAERAVGEIVTYLDKELAASP
jgi:hypothetical protein